MKKIIFVVNTPEFFISHRLPIAIAAKKIGYQIHVITGSGNSQEKIEECGLIHHVIPLERSGQNPIEELKSVQAIYRLFAKEKPDLVHLVTIKPVLYGGLAARMAKVPAVVAAISGLGTIFLDQSGIKKLRRFFTIKLYRYALSHKRLRVIFQNHDDRNLFISQEIIRESSARIIRGSGVRLSDYLVKPEPTGKPTITFAARLLKDKGILEFIEAAKILMGKGIDVKMRVVGEPDAGNTSSITKTELTEWKKLNNVEFVGFRNDINQQYATSNIVCLPSYREGLPKSLVEAAACGRAVITTDVPGCRDAIIPAQSGLLVPAKNAIALADAIIYLVKSPEVRERMGLAGRALAEGVFDIDLIINAHLDIYSDLTSPLGSH